MDKENNCKLFKNQQNATVEAMSGNLMRTSEMNCTKIFFPKEDLIVRHMSHDDAAESKVWPLKAP